jgi:Raf kinase inhibitor-like YbhB/YbcL family protein
MAKNRVWRLVLGALFLMALRGFAEDAAPVDITASGFKQGEAIPVKYAQKGGNLSPELHFGTEPANAVSLVLIVDDLDAPTGVWTHWLVWGLRPDTSGIPEGRLPAGAIQGKNSFGHTGYDGPVPPSGTHRYFFHIFALDTAITLSAGSDRAALEAAMKGHIVGKGVTFGTYSTSL